jgi:hypothetical protein
MYHLAYNHVCYSSFPRRGLAATDFHAYRPHVPGRRIHGGCALTPVAKFPS